MRYFRRKLIEDLERKRQRLSRLIDILILCKIDLKKI
jgi:hypothetical protein